MYDILHLLNCRQQQETEGERRRGGVQVEGHWLDSNRESLSYVVCFLNLWVTKVYAFEHVKHFNRDGISLYFIHLDNINKRLNVDLICSAHSRKKDDCQISEVITDTHYVEG